VGRVNERNLQRHDIRIGTNTRPRGKRLHLGEEGVVIERARADETFRHLEKHTDHRERVHGDRLARPVLRARSRRICVALDGYRGARLPEAERQAAGLLQFGSTAMLLL
jgi:hypothetical protein